MTDKFIIKLPELQKNGPFTTIMINNEFINVPTNWYEWYFNNDYESMQMVDLKFSCRIRNISDRARSKKILINRLLEWESKFTIRKI